MSQENDPLDNKEGRGDPPECLQLALKQCEERLKELLSKIKQTWEIDILWGALPLLRFDFVHGSEIDLQNAVHESFDGNISKIDSRGGRYLREFVPRVARFAKLAIHLMSRRKNVDIDEELVHWALSVVDRKTVKKPKKTIFSDNPKDRTEKKIVILLLSALFGNGFKRYGFFYLGFCGRCQRVFKKEKWNQLYCCFGKKGKTK